jgi:hypothetical protein
VQGADDVMWSQREVQRMRKGALIGLEFKVFKSHNMSQLNPIEWSANLGHPDIPGLLRANFALLAMILSIPHFHFAENT